MLGSPQGPSGQRRTALIISAVLGVTCLIALNVVSNPPSKSEETGPTEPVAESGPPSNAIPDKSPDPQKAHAAAAVYVDTLIKRSQGDFKRLSQDEQDYVSNLMAGRATAIFRERWEAIQKARKAARKPTTPSPRK